MALNLKRGLLVGTSIGVATVGAATMAPAALVIFGAFGVCTGWGFGLAGLTGALGFAAGSVGKVDEWGPVGAEIFAGEQSQARATAGLDEVVQSNLTLRADLAQWEAFETDLLHLTHVLVGAACCDGPASAIEMDCIRKNVFASSYLTLPEAVQDKIQRVLGKPIRLRDAYSHFGNIKSGRLRDLTRALMDTVMACDTGSAALNPSKQSYLVAWDVLADDQASMAA